MSRRTKRVEKLIQETVSQILAESISDPRLEFATITDVAVSPDLKHANVFYSTIVEKSELPDVQAAFVSATPFIQRLLTEMVHLQYAPKVHFKYDDTLSNAQKIEKLIDETLQGGDD